MTKAMCVLLLAIFVAATSARAETAPAPANGSALTPAEAARALEVLDDPAKQAQLIDTLRALAKAAPPAAGAAPKAAAPAHAGQLSLRPNGLGAQFVVLTARWAKDASRELADAASAAANLPALEGEAAVLLADPAARNEALEAIWRTVLVFGCAFLAEALLALVLRRQRDRLEVGVPRGKAEPHEASPEGDPSPGKNQDASDDWRLMRRLPLALLRLTLSLLPVGAFAAVGGLLVLAQLEASDTTRVIVLEALEAYVVFRAILCAIRMLVSPANRRLRLLQVSDAAAADIENWARWVAGVAVVGGALAETVQLLDADSQLHSAIVRASAFVLGAIALTLVLRRRAAIAQAIRPREGAHERWTGLRNRLADTWHYLAIAVIVMFWLVWTVVQQDGFARSLQLVAVSVGVLILARLVSIVALGLFDRAIHLSRDLAAQFQQTGGRAGRYVTLVRGLIRFAVGWATLVLLLEVWGFDAITWFEGRAIGARLVSALLTIGAAAAIAVCVWEGVNTAVERHLARLSREARFARAARLRTLLPLLRTTILVVVVGIVGLTFLSEIGVNVAPLLAGAGIVGIAIGFGSQKLVQDLITGLFLLLENAVQVGDWVTVSGLSGSVENLSIRTIRLRASDGSVHIVPFSSVTSVTNSNRGVGNAAVSVSVAFDEDTDRVGEALRQIAVEMRHEDKFKTAMLTDLQFWGVDKVDGVSATLVGQIVCTDTGRWEVQREFNRRMKQRFQQLGIAISPPNTSVMMQTAARPTASPPAASEDDSGPSLDRPANVRFARG
ncbi:MAG TPA: mechanosensitive ion channel domain-containing protein [Roseiarcus sp.]